MPGSQPVILEMRIRFPLELEDVPAVKAELADRVKDVDPRPEFFTAEPWLIPMVDSLLRQGEVRGRGNNRSDWMPHGNTRRRG